MSESRDEVPIPTKYNHLHGRPGNWINERSRNGGGIVLGDGTYEAMRKNVGGVNGPELSLDEVITYTVIISDMFDSLNNAGKNSVDIVRNENGIERDGIVYNQTIENVARIIGSEDLSSVFATLNFSLILPGYHDWSKMILDSDGDYFPLLEITQQNNDLERTIDVLNAKLLMFQDEGYTAAGMASRTLKKAKQDYKDTQISLRDMLTEAAHYLIENRDKILTEA